MKESKPGTRRLFTLLLSVLLLSVSLCIALKPAPAFAAECEHELKTVQAVQATCQHTGHLAYRQCSKCGAIFDAIEAKEVNYQDLVTPIADHKWKKTSETKATASKNGKITYTCSVCGTTYDEATHYVPKPSLVRRFTLNGYKLRFTDLVVKKVPKYMKKSRISHVWIKSYKKKIKVNWDPAENMNNVDGVIILRRTGRSTKNPFKEIKRIEFRKTSKGAPQWKPKFSYMDKDASKKNCLYTYIVVSYKVVNGYTYISNCSEWAAGQTTLSKLKNAYKGNISKSSDTMQYNDKQRLKIWHKKPKKFLYPNNIRWYSDNKNIAKVSSKGLVTAVSPGNTTIRGRLASGCDVTCDITVVGAFEPDAPTLKLDYATESSISLIWNSVEHATNYDLYCSDDGLHWDDPIRLKGTKKKVDGLIKGHRYTFYVVAVNVNGPYVAESDNSNVLNQKAVIKRRDTQVSGWPTYKSISAGSTYSVNVRVTTPTHRKARLQMKSGRRWVTMKTIQLPYGAAMTSVNISFPNDWWGKTTYWRLYIPKNTSSSKYISKTLTIKSLRRYQNPSGYVQISDTISKHGYSYYVSPVLVNSASTRYDHIEALIKTASKYKGDSYVNMRSGAPGGGIDASGLVIQSCYGAGVDLWPISPSTRPYNCVPSIMNSRLARISYSSWDADKHYYMTRGDLVFFQIEPGNYGHVAIYLGMDRIIHASPVTGRVETSTIADLIMPVEEGGLYGYDESKIQVRRIFN